MISVEEAQTRVLAGLKPIDSELEDLVHLTGRVAAEDIRALGDNPPAPIATVNGYALRRSDGEAPRKVAGKATPGHPFQGTVGTNEAVRIVIGGIIPAGADAIAFAEDAEDGDLPFSPSVIQPDFIRGAGHYEWFQQGERFRATVSATINLTVVGKHDSGILLEVQDRNDLLQFPFGPFCGGVPTWI